MATHPHHTAIGVVEPGDETGDGGLAPAGPAQEAERFARGQGEADLLEDPAVLVRERHVVELDCQRPGGHDLRTVGDRRAEMAELIDADDPTCRLLQLLELLGHLLDRSPNQLHVLEDQERGAHRDRAANGEPHPDIRARASPAQKAVLAETQTRIRFRQALVVRV